jgi:hypothetical protein
MRVVLGPGQQTASDARSAGAALARGPGRAADLLAALNHCILVSPTGRLSQARQSHCNCVTACTDWQTEFELSLV